MKSLMKGLLLVMALAGCSDEIGPDPSGGTGASTANSMGGHGGEGATGGGGGDAGGSSSSGGSAPGGGFESGERLKAKTLMGADGARSPAGWYDSQLGIDCAWKAAADGQTRCLPSTGVVASLFADAACTIPVGTSSGTCSLPTHLYVPIDTCSSGFRVHPVTSPYAGTTFIKAGVDCIDIGPTANAVIGGGEITSSTFVSATIEIEL